MAKISTYSQLVVHALGGHARHAVDEQAMDGNREEAGCRPRMMKASTETADVAADQASVMPMVAVRRTAQMPTSSDTREPLHDGGDVTRPDRPCPAGIGDLLVGSVAGGGVKRIEQIQRLQIKTGCAAPRAAKARRIRPGRRSQPRPS